MLCACVAPRAGRGVAVSVGTWASGHICAEGRGMPRPCPPFLVQTFPPRPLTAPASRSDPGGSQSLQTLTSHSPLSQGPLHLPARLLLYPCSQDDSRSYGWPGGPRAPWGQGGGRKRPPGHCSTRSPPNQESLKKVVPGFSQHLGQMGRPLWMYCERLQTQMERVQRWGVFRIETWRVWARLRVFLETT